MVFSVDKLIWGCFNYECGNVVQATDTERLAALVLDIDLDKLISYHENGLKILKGLRKVLEKKETML